MVRWSAVSEPTVSSCSICDDRRDFLAMRSSSEGRLGLCSSDEVHEVMLCAGDVVVEEWVSPFHSCVVLGRRHLRHGP